MLILTDNGSLSPASALALRALAGKVAARVGEPVAPVSLLHSSTITPEALGGERAEILEPFLEKKLREGIARFRVLPAFFGPSLALTDYLPKRVAALKRRFPELDVRLAPCLCDTPEDHAVVADILVRRIRDKMTPGVRPAVVLVDHGSPARAVAEVRDRLAESVRDRLGDTVSGVLAASMERREGPEYDFNEPLLAAALRSPGFDRGPVIAALQFLFPGRHAGAGGDIAAICDEARRDRPELRVVTTETVGDDDAMAALLARKSTDFPE